MDIDKFAEFIKQGDSRFGSISVTKNEFMYGYDVMVYFKKPYENYFVREFIAYELVESLNVELNTYHPMVKDVVYRIRRCFEEELIKQSFEEVKKYEPKLKPIPQTDIETAKAILDKYNEKYVTVQEITNKFFTNQTLYDFTEAKSVAEKYYTEHPIKPIYEFDKVVKTSWQKEFENSILVPSKTFVQEHKGSFTVEDPPIFPGGTPGYKMPQSKLVAFSGSVVGKIAQVCPGINEQVKCPGCGLMNKLARVIIHLNDNQCYKPWSREEVADWIESLDVNTEIIGAVK